MAEPAPVVIVTTRNRWCEAAAYVLAGLALLGVLVFHLLVPLLAGLLIYELVHLFTPFAQRYLSTRRGKVIVVALFAILMIVAVVSATLGLIGYFRNSGNLGGLLQRMSNVLERLRGDLPPQIVENLPATVVDLQAWIVRWLRAHMNDMQSFGSRTAVLLAQTLIALVVGASLSLQEVVEHRKPGPLGVHLLERIQRFLRAFHHIASSQLRISLVNTGFTALYLLVILPAFGTQLPFTKTMIAITFVVGLLPVIGNLISNTIIVLISLGQSSTIAFASLAFLVAIHKLEYFLDARIVGGSIDAKVWELLLAMLVMEACFGVPGLVAAPIYYAYLKSEMVDAKLI